MTDKPRGSSSTARSSDLRVAHRDFDRVLRERGGFIPAETSDETATELLETQVSSGTAPANDSPGDWGAGARGRPPAESGDDVIDRQIRNAIRVSRGLEPERDPIARGGVVPPPH